MIQEAISRVTEGTDLLPLQADVVVRSIMEGSATPAQVGALLAGLRVKKESFEVAMASRFKEKYVKINLQAFQQGRETVR